jgi:hypothetical protein
VAGVSELVRTSYVAECFWTGVNEEAVRAVDERSEASAAEVSRDGEAVRFLGSILMLQDEVVLFLFEGSAAAVRRAANLAEIPFERILESSNSRWPATASAPFDGDSGTTT